LNIEQFRIQLCVNVKLVTQDTAKVQEMSIQFRGYAVHNWKMGHGISEDRHVSNDHRRLHDAD